MNTLQRNVSNFKLQYSYNIKDNYQLYKSMQKFESSNNAKIAILSKEGDIIYLPNPKSSIDDSTKIYIRSILNHIIDNGSLKDIMQGKEENITMLLSNPDLDLKNIVSITPISLNLEKDSIIIAFSPFQPIEEASGVIKDFFIYMFIFALIAIAILSIIYANIISKPLTALNKVASKMSNLDFSEKCPINSEDEIGNLAKTLNFLSLNLYNALEELKIANLNLKKDIEKEKLLENMRKDFVANASHELKTPIALIEGYAEGIKDGVVDDYGKEEYLDVIIDEAHKMNSLVMDMLELSKLESPSFKLDIGEFSILDLINGCIRELCSYIELKNITLLCDNKDTMVLGDRFRIEQVITNLLTNAIDHCNPDGIIKVSFDNMESWIKISISNTGTPIPQEEMKNIWDKFYKIDKARTRILGGTGLGLAIVKNILLLHDSNFGVKNLSNNEVCFFFTLKIARI